MAIIAARKINQYGRTYFKRRLRSSIRKIELSTILYRNWPCPKSFDLQLPFEIWHLFHSCNIFPEKNHMRRSIAVIVVGFVAFVASALMAVGQVDVPRRTTAITYPLDELVLVQFRGTTRFPRMKGEARIKRTSRNGTE